MDETATTIPKEYLQVSPVRGQLEPHDGTSRSGWRYIQCTDTPNELKVLIPPRTASLYALLLKAEAAELHKAADASWARILDIRRLKDRMIRKCQRLAQQYNSLRSSETSPFVTLHAPPDFRLKEMEKWIRQEEVITEGFGQLKINTAVDSLQHQQQAVHRRVSSHSVHSRRSSERMTQKQASSRRSSQLKQSSSSHAEKTSGSVKYHRATNYDSRFHEDITEEDFHARHSTEQIGEQIEQEQRLNELFIGRENVEGHMEMPAPAFPATSPEPLPHPLHGSSSMLFQAVVEPPAPEFPLPETHEPPAPEFPLPETHEPPAPEFPVPELHESPTSSSGDLPLLEFDAGRTPRPGLTRRRSSLKRSNEALRFSAYSAKSVSWAMDRDWTEQVTKYEAAQAELKEADRDWDEICASYREELGLLRSLRRNVGSSIQRLQGEVERLHQEEGLVRAQEEKLHMSFEQLQMRHQQYRTRVKSVMEETQQVINYCNTKRDELLQAL